jgi:hypothetical protein
MLRNAPVSMMVRPWVAAQQSMHLAQLLSLALAGATNTYASPSQLLFSSLVYSCALQSSTYDDLFIRFCSWEKAFQTDTTYHKHELHHGIYNLTKEKKVTRTAKLGHTVARTPLWLRQRELSGAVLRSQSLYVSTPLTKLLVSRHDWRMPLVSSKAN